MKSTAFLILICLFVSTGWSQSLPDTLNRFDSKKRKTGYWLAYLDSNIVKTEKSTAVYGGYEYYLKGKVKSAPFSKKNKWKGAEIVYKPFSKVYLDSILILDGEVSIVDEYTQCLERYRNGHVKFIETHYYSKKDDEYAEDWIESIYLDSLFENTPFTLLVYNTFDSITTYKQYGGRDLKQDRIYLIPHTTKTAINKPRIGYTYQNRSFIELGYSRKFCRTTKVGEGSFDIEDLHFPGFTLSLLGTWSQKRGNYFGQKALFSYNFTLLNSEIGLVNYTDFKNNDLRFTIGTGISLAGRFSVLYHYSLPVLSNSFSDISRHSISIVLF